MKIQELTIEARESEPDSFSAWKPGTPGLVLILIHNGDALLLDYCGNANDFEACEGDLKGQLEDEYEWSDCEKLLADGLWIIPCEPEYTQDRYGEVDGGLDFGTPRRLTKQEWAWFKECNEDPWQTGVWPEEWKSEEPVINDCGNSEQFAGCNQKHFVGLCFERVDECWDGS